MNSPVCSPPDQKEPAPDDLVEGSRPRRRNILIAAVLAVVAIITGVVITRAARNPAHKRDDQSITAPAPSSQTLRLTGKTQAVQARIILAPVLAGEQVNTLTITKLAPSGTHVKRGDLLVEFDRQAQIRDIVDKQDKSDSQNDDVIEAQAKELAARAKDETEIKQAEDSLGKAQLEMQKVELLSRIDAEKAQENLDEAKATLAQLKETFGLKRKAAQASIRILEIQRDRTSETMLHSQANAELMQIRSPIDGIVVLNTIWKQGNMGQVEEGDQVRSGVPFMQVIDPSIMEVNVKVNQEDILALTPGQKVRVYLDAYPDLVFPGRLESIDPMGQEGDFSSKLRAFKATFSIEGSDPRLMPDLSAAVEIVRPSVDTATKAATE